MPPVLNGVLKRQLNSEETNRLDEYYQYARKDMNVNQFIFATLQNRGDKEASHVVIHFPGAKQIRMVDIDKNLVKAVFNAQQIDIDKISPSQRFYFHVWTENEDEDEALSISAAHSEGLIKVRKEKRYYEDYVFTMKILNLLAGGLFATILLCMVWAFATNRSDP